MGYSSKDNYCDKAEKWQSVLSESEQKNELASRGLETDTELIKSARENTNYSCADSYQMGTIKDDHIYISTTNNQHDQIVKGEKVDADGGISGYFTDQATINNCTQDDVLDNGKLNREVQVAPYQKDANSEPGYKPHVDSFKINQDKLEENYKTRDFNAAISKCEANNQFGEGGGNQGFNPNIDEMIQNGSLEYDKTQSYSDPKLSNNSDTMNTKSMNNSTISQDDYDNMIQDAKDRSGDCVKNNTEHPSQEIVNNTGYEHNPNPIQSNTGNATLINENKNSLQDNESIQKNKDNTLPNIQNNQVDRNQNSEKELSADKNNQNKGKQSASEGISTTASGSNNPSEGKKSSSEGISTTASRSNNPSEGKKSSSEGISNTAAGSGQSQHYTPSSSSGQSKDSGMSQ